MRSPTHSVKNRQRLQQPPESAGREQRRRRRRRREQESGPQPHRPDRQRRRMHGSRRRCAERCHQHESEQTESAIDEDNRRRQRFRSGGARRIADPNHVAADVARQEIVEELRDEERAEQPPARDIDLLRLEQNPPAPGRGEHVDQEDPERERQPPERRAPRDLPEMADVDAREQQRQQDHADGDFHRHQDVTTHGGRTGEVRGTV